jgi:hypothetical protein
MSPVPANTRVVLHRFLGGAWGGEYELRVSALGRVSFRGHIGLRKDSVESGRITRAEVENILAAARSAEFFSLAKEYGPRVYGNDHARVNLSIAAGKQSRSVEWQEYGEGDMSNVERRLSGLEKLVIDTAGAEPWIKKHCTLEGLPNNGMNRTRNQRRS